MIINVRKLNAQKQYTGTLEFEYTAPEELMDLPFSKFAAPVRVEAEYELYEDDSLALRGKLFYVIEGQCSRCLKDTSCEVVGEIDAYFQPFEGGEDYAYKNGSIDLTDAINDAIMESIPRVLSCGDDCPGIEGLIKE